MVSSMRPQTTPYYSSIQVLARGGHDDNIAVEVMQLVNELASTATLSMAVPRFFAVPR